MPPLICADAPNIPKNAILAHFTHDLQKNCPFLTFLTSEMDSATSNYVKKVFNSFGTFFELDLFDSVIQCKLTHENWFYKVKNSFH